MSLKKKVKMVLFALSAYGFVISSICFYVFFIKTDMGKKSLSAIGLIEYDSSENRHQVETRIIQGWANCLEKIGYEADAVFYGNSITFESCFHIYFPNVNICNMGCNRDNLGDLINRAHLIRSVHPKKVFLLGGINGLVDISLDKFRQQYEILVKTIKTQNPSSTLILQSLLPVNKSMYIGSRYAESQGKILEANVIIRDIAIKENCTFIDLYDAYQADGSLPCYYTRDGLHLLPEAYSIWAKIISPYLE